MKAIIILIQSKNCEKSDEKQRCLEFILRTHKAVAQALDEVECIKELFFSTSATRQEIVVVEEEAHLNPPILLLSRSLRYCRDSDNTMFGLISHYYFAANLSTSENQMEKKKTKVISARVSEHLAYLLEEYCRQNSYINCSEFCRNALREKLRKDAPERFEWLFEGVPAEQEEEKIASE